MVLHLQALAATIGLVLSMLLWVRGANPAIYAFIACGVFLAYVTYGWIKDTIKVLDRTRRHGLILGFFGVAMFAFSYAMVPLYHILCHGNVALPESASSHPVDIDIMFEKYRGLPIAITVSESQLELGSGESRLVYVTLENHANKALDIKLSISTNPRTIKPYFGLVTPDVIHLPAWERTQFPIEVKFNADVPDDLWQTAILLLFQDINGVGELGKTDAWEKMHHAEQIGVRS